MLLEFASPILLFLVVLMAMVGYVELGTDSWITNIMNNVIKGKAFLLFVYMSTLMFVLRFFAGPIVERINPIGLLFCGSCLACYRPDGLELRRRGGPACSSPRHDLRRWARRSSGRRCWASSASDSPKAARSTMGTVGGIGMLSAGLLGGPGIGYQQDYFAAKELQEKSPSTFERYVAEEKSHFLFFEPISGLDGKKVGELMEKVDANQTLDAQQKADAPVVEDAALLWRTHGPALHSHRPRAHGVRLSHPDRLLPREGRIQGRDPSRQADGRRRVHRRRRSAARDLIRESDDSRLRSPEKNEGSAPTGGTEPSFVSRRIFRR